MVFINKVLVSYLHYNFLSVSKFSFIEPSFQNFETNIYTWKKFQSFFEIWSKITISLFRKRVQVFGN